MYKTTVFNPISNDYIDTTEKIIVDFFNNKLCVSNNIDFVSISAKNGEIRPIICSHGYTSDLIVSSIANTLASKLNNSMFHKQFFSTDEDYVYHFIKRANKIQFLPFRKNYIIEC